MAFKYSELNDVSDVIDSPHTTPAYSKQGFPMVRCTDVKYGELNLKTTLKVDSDVFREFSRRYTPTSGDIIITRVGSYGISAKVKEVGFCLGQNTSAIVPKTINGNFLYYALNSHIVGKQIEAGVVGSTQKTLSLKVIKALKIPRFGDVGERKIAETLSALDDRITLLRETNATLEAIAQALFKSWFVDFDPVRAKAEGREPEGMPADVAELFPSEFEDTELGEIPKGWKVCSLDQIAKFLNGLAMQKFPVEAGVETLPVIKIAQLRKGDTIGADKASSNIKPEYVVYDGDVLFSWSGSLEVEIWCGGKGALNQHLFKVSSDEYPKWFYYLWTKHHLANFREIAAGKATTMGHIQRHHLVEAKVITPSPKLLAEMSAVILPIMDRAIACMLQIKTLTELRDTLLPRLMSGKLRIPDLEEQAA